MTKLASVRAAMLVTLSLGFLSACETTDEIKPVDAYDRNITGFTRAPLEAAPIKACEYEQGEDRWDVKTSVPDVDLLDHAQPVTLESLMSLDNPDLSKEEKRDLEKSGKLYQPAVKLSKPDGGSVQLHEGDIVTVTGYVYRLRCQKDGDYHIEIGASPRREDGECLIVELPDVGEVHNRVLRKAITEALGELEQGLPRSFFGNPSETPKRVEFTGQLFLDAHHLGNRPSGGRGTVYNGQNCATNVWEIHPVTAAHVVTGPNA